jgi:hypothetical protein
VDVVTLARPKGVTKTLVMTALALVARCNCRVGGKHTRRTTNFVKACLAFAHVTIPAVGSDKVWQLHAFLLAGQAALSTGLLSQTDSLLKASIRPHACRAVSDVLMRRYTDSTQHQCTATRFDSPRNP